jgi:hypothetical protein
VVVTNIATPLNVTLDNSVATLTVVTAAAPAVHTSSATEVGFTSATLNGAVNPNWGKTRPYFEYGLTTNYGGTILSSTISNGTNLVSVSQRVFRLRPGSVYHYRLSATNIAGAGFGADQTFTTPPGLAITDFALQPDGKFRLQFSGIPGSSYSVLGSTDLVNWQVLGDASENTFGYFEFTDTDSSSQARRFYKLRAP